MNDEPGERVSGTLGTGVTYARRGAALGQPGRSAHLCQKGAAGSDTRVSPGWRPRRQNLSARSESSPVVSGCLRLLHTMHMHVMLTWFLRHSCGQDIITSWGFVDIPVTLNSLKTSFVYFIRKCPFCGHFILMTMRLHSPGPSPC